ncbi:oxidoreductase [Actinocatenispora thailandica]|uniref:Oxidoreductase n=1 Tax=Actinocatenispora thailandica TaxID=227318 RepID=A0A7R7DLS4_9ACTN|nr:FAD-dependent oxidoreductase [Actinocatenispora thailandica]BCJ33875.1 oxidoreductase [Actinocatenispora thailandica]
MNDRIPYDVVIVGAGAAGLSAAVLLARTKHRILIISLTARRNSTAEVINNVPYAHGTRPTDVFAKMEADAKHYGAAFVWDAVDTARASADSIELVTRGGASYIGRRLLLAAGTVNEMPSWVPMEAWGKAVFDCPYCHTYEHDGAAFVSVGTGEEALKHALLCQQYTKDLTTLVSDPDAAQHEFADRLRMIGSRVFVDSVTSATVLDSGKLRLLTAKGRELIAGTVVLDFIIRPNQLLPRQLGLELSPNGYPRATPFGKTSHPRVYSAGNNPGSPYFMWTGAACSGINAARQICEDIAFGD